MPQVFQCSGDDMNLVLTGGVTPAATSPKVLSPGTLVSPPPPAPAPRLLAHHIAHQSLLARQHENLLLASLRPPLLPMLPTYAAVRSQQPTAQAYQLPQMSQMSQMSQMLQQQSMLPTKRSYERAFQQTEALPAKRPYTMPPQMTPALSLPVFSYGTSASYFLLREHGFDVVDVQYLADCVADSPAGRVRVCPVRGLARVDDVTVPYVVYVPYVPILPGRLREIFNVIEVERRALKVNDSAF